MAFSASDYESTGFNSYEGPVLVILDNYLRDESSGPLLTNNEEDLVIVDDMPFIDKASQSWLPHNALERRRLGDLGDEQVARRLRIGRNVVRKTKAGMFTDRLMVATGAVDTCRSVFRAAIGQEFVPVPSYDDDTLLQARNRVGDYVTDLLDAGRERRVLRNAAMHRLTDTIRAKFDFDANPEASLVLTGLAGMNSRKKVMHYAQALHTISKGYDRMTKADKDRLNAFMARRHPDHQDGLDLYTVIASPPAPGAGGA
ncbi:MAG: hypothetical protein WAQ57_02575 [Candidatus Saccharimonadales bacterium]